MKTFVLIRHAKSSWAQPQLSDRQRPLKVRGERDAKLIGKYLRSRDWSIDRCYSSPAVRAEQTARIVTAKRKLDIAVEESLYTFNHEALLDWLRHLDSSLQTVLAFGHNPAITDLVNYLAAENIENVPTCGLAKLDFDLDNWVAIEQGMARLDAFVVPKTLR